MRESGRFGWGVAAIALLVLGGCATTIVEGDTTVYFQVSWMRGFVWFFCGLGVVDLPLLLFFVKIPRTTSEEEHRTMLRTLWIAFLCVLAFGCYSYYDYTKSGVTVNSDGVSVRRNSARSAETFRFEDLQSLETKYFGSPRTGGGGAYFLCATPKPPPGETWSESEKQTKRIEIVLSPAVKLALPDIFRKAVAKGVQCEDDR